VRGEPGTGSPSHADADAGMPLGSCCGPKFLLTNIPWTFQLCYVEAMTYSMEFLQAKLDRLLAEEPALDPDKIKRIAQLSIRLLAGAKNPPSYFLGASRMAGVPDVPGDFQWPYFEPQEGDTDCCGTALPLGRPLPLEFIAQLDLAKLPRIDPAIPSTGWLYFFYDVKGQPSGIYPKHKDRFRVIYVDCPRDDLHPAQVPDGFDEDFQPWEHWPLVSEVDWTLPGGYVDFGEFDSPRFAAYERLAEKLTLPGQDRSRFLGHAELVQNPMDDLGDPFGDEEIAKAMLLGFLEGEFAAENPDIKRSEALEEDMYPWRLLLQVDSNHDDGNFTWGSAGRLYFLIRKEDLIARRFDRIWLNLQTT